MDELSSFNRERWNGLVRAGVLYSRPNWTWTEASAREVVDEAGLLGDGGARRFCPGRRRRPAVGRSGLLGAQVTVLDLSDEQLEQDRRAAEHYGLSPVLLQGDMRDLTRFADDDFDIVYQPFSINFVPDVRPVFAGVARILKAGGLYHVQWHNPYTQTYNPDDYDPVRGYSSNSIYRDGEVDVKAIYGTDTWGVETEDGSKIEVPGPREFRHTMPTFINGLIACRFEILAFSEHTTWEEDPEPGSWEHFKAVSPPYLAFWTRRKSGVDR